MRLKIGYPYVYKSININITIFVVCQIFRIGFQPDMIINDNWILWLPPGRGCLSCDQLFRVCLGLIQGFFQAIYLGCFLIFTMVSKIFSFKGLLPELCSIQLLGFCVSETILSAIWAIRRHPKLHKRLTLHGQNTLPQATPRPGFYLSNYLSIYLSVCLSVCLSAYLKDYLLVPRLVKSRLL